MDNIYLIVKRITDLGSAPVYDTKDKPIYYCTSWEEACKVIDQLNAEITEEEHENPMYSISYTHQEIPPCPLL